MLVDKVEIHSFQVDTFFKPLSTIKRNASLIKFPARKTSGPTSAPTIAPSYSPTLSSISSSPHSSPVTGRKPSEAKAVSGDEVSANQWDANSLSSLLLGAG